MAYEDLEGLEVLDCFGGLRPGLEQPMIKSTLEGPQGQHRHTSMIAGTIGIPVHPDDLHASITLTGVGTTGGAGAFGA